jgi:hypothetical protein
MAEQLDSRRPSAVGAALRWGVAEAHRPLALVGAVAVAVALVLLGHSLGLGLGLLAGSLAFFVAVFVVVLGMALPATDWAELRQGLTGAAAGLPPVTVELGLLGVQASQTWELDRSRPERELAWTLYVELASRITTQPLGADAGLLRDTLTSQHSLYETTRVALRAAGPPLHASGAQTVQALALAVLNGELRRFQARWHARLKLHEEQHRAAHEGAGQAEVEAAWPEAAACRAELQQVQVQLRHYAETLHTVATGQPLPEVVAQRP